MKNLFKLFTLVLVVGLALSSTAWGQPWILPSLENFSYANGTALNTQGGWAMFSGTANQILVSTGNLMYTGYPLASGIGAQVSLVNTNGEDVRYDIVDQGPSAGTKVYASFLVNVTNTTGLVAKASLSSNNQSVFAGFLNGTSNFSSRLWIASVTGGYDLGISKDNTPASVAWANGTYLTGTTYLIVIYYEYNGSTTTDDVVKFWVNPSLSGPEPSATATATGTDMGSTGLAIQYFMLRQASPATPNAIIDGLKIANTWVDAPLPIQLASFVGSYVENGAKLQWETISEVNNYGFNVQRQSGDEYVTIGFVEGKGMPSTYEYIDVQAGTTYRLEQMDNDGLTTYYGPIMLNPNSVGDNVPAVFALNQNYPNPFNPSTVINYQLATDNYTTLKVYNLIGKEVATLVNGYVTAGSHQVTFDGSHLTSGMYFYKLQSGNNVEVKKLTLVK